MKTIIIGDIHGCYQELVKLLEKTGFNEAEDRLISLGDLMDRGKQSYEVFDYFRGLKLRMEDRCVVIRGNHEVMMMEAGEDLFHLQLWYQNGGLETVASFEMHGDSTANHLDWFEENTVLHYVEDRFQCVHAGLENEDPEKNSIETLIWDRAALIDNVYKGKLTIVGHTPLKVPIYYAGNWLDTKLLGYDENRKLPKTGFICIDTGCVYGCKLTAMIIEGRKYRMEAVPGSG